MVDWNLPRRTGGFTLVELIMAVVVVGVLAGALVPAISTAVRRARAGAFRAQIAQVQGAVDQFYALNGYFPAHGQPGACPDGYQVNSHAAGRDGRVLVSGYLRSLPETLAQELGLAPGYGATVYYGVMAHGKVFATQTPPDAAGRWTDRTAVIYVPEKVPEHSTLAEACLSGTSPLTLTLSTAQEEVAVGGSILVTVRVTRDEIGVPDTRVRIRATGSVTGDHFYTVITDADGIATQAVSTDQPEYMLVSAAVE